jgi:hypothetical protein
MEDIDMQNGQANTGIWIGIAVGAAVGIGIALSRRKRSRTTWEQARDVTRRVANRSGDLADATRDLMERVKAIYAEGRKVVEDAGDLWEQSRKMVGV